jgi:hypothetical protein
MINHSLRPGAAAQSQQVHVRCDRAQWPPAAAVELGEFGLDVDIDDAEEVDVLRARRGDVGKDLIGHVAADGSQINTWGHNLLAETSIRYGGYGTGVRTGSRDLTLAA